MPRFSIDPTVHCWHTDFLLVLLAYRIWSGSYDESQDHGEALKGPCRIGRHILIFVAGLHVFVAGLITSVAGPFTYFFSFTYLSAGV